MGKKFIKTGVTQFLPTLPKQGNAAHEYIFLTDAAKLRWRVYEMLCQNIYRMYLSCQSEWYLIIDIPSGIIQCLCRYLQRIYSLWKEGKKAEKQITFIWTGTQVSYYLKFHILNVSFTNNIVCQCIIIINGKQKGKVHRVSLLCKDPPIPSCHGLLPLNPFLINEGIQPVHYECFLTSLQIMSVKSSNITDLNRYQYVNKGGWKISLRPTN